MEFLKYFIVMYIYMLSPGPSMALISKNAAKFGAFNVKYTIFGIITSIAIFSFLAVVGVGAIIHLYPNTFKTFKIIGSFYIMYIGVQIFLSAKKNVFTIEGGAKKQSVAKEYFTGLTTDLANPLSIVGITSIILGFVNVSTPYSAKIIFFLITILCAFCYAYTYAFLFGNKISCKFIAPKMQMFEKVAGIAVLLIGVTFLIKSL